MLSECDLGMSMLSYQALVEACFAKQTAPRSRVKGKIRPFFARPLEASCLPYPSLSLSRSHDCLHAY